MVWEGIIEFTTVADVNSFTSAAIKLDTSVAQVSRKVASLEKQLGVKLFNRSTRNVSLTEAGRVYYAQCAPALAALQDAELMVTELQRVPSGLIKMTVPVAFGEAFVAPLLNRFLKQYTDISIECKFSNDTVDIIEQGLDLAIRIGRLEDSSLVAKKLATRQLFVCASEDYLRKHGEPKVLDDLKAHACLVGSHSYWRFHWKGESRVHKIQGRIKYNSGNALRHAALEGLGLVQLPGFYVRNDLEKRKLIEVLADHRDEKEAVWALFPSNRHMAPKVRVLVDYLGQHLEDG